MASSRLWCSIVEINQSLVDDGKVDKKKIGGSNYFWSFPAKENRLKQIKYEKTLQDIEATKVKVEEASARLADARRGREDDDGERAKKLARISELAKEKTALQTELEALKENDPQALADLEKELKLVTEAANRWTDNIFNCKTFLTRKRGIDKKEANKILGISDAFDCKFGAPWSGVMSVIFVIKHSNDYFFLYLPSDPEDKIPK